MALDIILQKNEKSIRILNLLETFIYNLVGFWEIFCFITAKLKEVIHLDICSWK